MKPFRLKLSDGAYMSIITPIPELEIVDTLFRQKLWRVIEINGKIINEEKKTEAGKK